MDGSSSEGTLLEAGESPQRASESASMRTPSGVGADAAEHAELQAEVVRLEGLLAASAADSKNQREEVARLRGLLRDAVAHLDDLALAGPEPATASEPSQGEAVARALEAEAARAELQFRLDELMGHMALAVGDVGRPGEPLDVACARLAGTARGLLSALAEMEDGRDVARARLLLAEQDLLWEQAHARDLERELSEAREHAELELVRARGLVAQAELAALAPPIETLRGELAGVQARSLETQRALEAAVDAFERSRSSDAQRSQQLSLARAELAQLQADRDQKVVNISELNQKLAREIETGREVSSQLGQAAAESIMLREELARARAETSDLRASMAHGGAEQGHRLEALGVDRDRAVRTAAEQQARARRLSDGLMDVRALLGELAVSLGRAIVGGSVSVAIEPQGSASNAPTEPGTPLEIDAIEGLEEQIALRDQRIVALSAELAGERGRVSAAVRTLEALHTSTEGGATSFELSRVLALLLQRT
jgi:hypothetical protein